MPRLKETPWEKRQIKFNSLVGQYMPIRHIPNERILAKRAGLGERTVESWKKNIGVAKLSNLIRVLDVLKVPENERVGLL